MRAPAETAPDISKILLQRTTYPLIHQIFDMETPRPVTAGPAEFPRPGPGKLSLPSFLYGNPWFRVTPSFLRLCPLFIRRPNTPTPPKGGNHSKRLDASPLSLRDPKHHCLRSLSLADRFVALPAPLGVALEASSKLLASSRPMGAI